MSLFTAENARAMALRAAEARRIARMHRAEAEARAKEFPPPITIPPPDAPDEYLAGRLARVRKQLDRLDTMLLTESDPAKLDRLAAATARLAEQERIIAGRPLPGSHRPSQPRRRTVGTVALVPE